MQVEAGCSSQRGRLALGISEELSEEMAFEWS